MMLPFLLPEEGFSCEIVCNVPSGLADFITPMCEQGLYGGFRGYSVMLEIVITPR